MRVLAGLLVFSIGVLLTADIHCGPPAPQAENFSNPLAAPALSVRYTSGRIEIRGASASEEHAAALRQLIAEQFDNVEADVWLLPTVLAGADWETASARLIYLVSASESAIANLRTDRLDVRGVTSRPDVFESRTRFLRESLPPDTDVSTDILVLKASATFDELCRRAFENLHLPPVSFHESSAEIREASFVSLERITEFARDCPSVTIEIRGHTDASGNESWNRKLSQSRARSVAEHLVSNGVDPERLIVRGLGSSEPIADNSTAQGREANRRIEFELR